MGHPFSRNITGWVGVLLSVFQLIKNQEGGQRGGCIRTKGNYMILLSSTREWGEFGLAAKVPIDKAKGERQRLAGEYSHILRYVNYSTSLSLH